MQISSQTPRPKSAPKPHPQSEPPREHDPGFLRDMVEKGVGLLSAVTKVPASILGGVAVGGYQGVKKGRNAGHEINPKAVATSMAVVNALPSVAVSAATGLVTAGPVGAAVNGGRKALEKGVRLGFSLRSDASRELGNRVAADLTKAVPAGKGAVVGGSVGLAVGAWSASKNSAAIGWHEGKGRTSGIIEGLSEIDDELKGSAPLPVGGLRKTGAVLAGTLGLVLAAPAGIATGVLGDWVNKGDKPPSTTKRFLIAGGAGAAAGAAIGFIGGPVGAAIGAGVGLVGGLLGPGARAGFQEGLAESVERAESNDGDMGNPLANNKRDTEQRRIVSSLAGLREGWDSGVGLFD